MWSFLCVFQLASAANAPYEFDLPPQKFLSTGLTGGGNLGAPSGSGFVGLESSYTVATTGKWVGATTGISVDVGQGQTLFTLGPKVGVLAFGVDGGLGVRTIREFGFDMGVQVRPQLNRLLAIFYRYGYWPSENGLPHVSVGLTVKLPKA